MLRGWKLSALFQIILTEFAFFFQSISRTKKNRPVNWIGIKVSLRKNHVQKTSCVFFRENFDRESNYFDLSQFEAHTWWIDQWFSSKDAKLFICKGQGEDLQGVLCSDSCNNICMKFPQRSITQWNFNFKYHDLHWKWTGLHLMESTPMCPKRKQTFAQDLFQRKF